MLSLEYFIVCMQCMTRIKSLLYRFYSRHGNAADGIVSARFISSATTFVSLMSKHIRFHLRDFTVPRYSIDFDAPASLICNHWTFGYYEKACNGETCIALRSFPSAS